MVLIVLCILFGPLLAQLLWVLFLLVFYKRQRTKLRFGVQELLLLPLALSPSFIVFRNAFESPHADIVAAAILLLSYQTTAAVGGWLTTLRRYPCGGWIPACAMVAAAWLSGLLFGCALGLITDMGGAC